MPVDLSAFVAAMEADEFRRRRHRRQHHTPVLMSNGMGVDSAAILLRWIQNPTSREFDLNDLTVVTAMTGDEFTETGQTMTRYLLPLMAAHRVRYAQVCRAGQSDEDGYVVLDDTVCPTQMFMQGPWSLSDEMRVNGTMPQRVGVRKCSLRAKGYPLDRFADTEYGAEDAGIEFRHAIGFAAEETGRAARDQCYGGSGRSAWYPLIDWGWDRQRCLYELRKAFGVTWPRSCCAYCPYAGGSRTKDAALAHRWSLDPDAGVKALALEYTAMALNPRQSLFRDQSGREVALRHNLADLVARVDGDLSRRPWAVYEVRRVIRRRGDTTAADGSIQLGGDRHGKGHPWRSIRTVRRGTAAEITDWLRTRVSAGRMRDDNGITRRWLLDAAATYPSAEWFLVAAPAGVIDKQRLGFDRLWNHTIGHQHGVAT